MTTLPLCLVNTPTVSTIAEASEVKVVTKEMEIPFSKIAVEVLPFDLRKVCPRLTMGWPLASTVVKAKIGGGEERLEIIDSGIMVRTVL